MTISYAAKVNQSYGKFFQGCQKFAVLPYVLTFNCVYDMFKSDNETEYLYGPLCAVFACMALTLCPVLPSLTTITLQLSLAAFLTGIMLYPFIYVFAAAIDVISDTFYSTCGGF